MKKSLAIILVLVLSLSLSFNAYAGTINGDGNINWTDPEDIHVDVFEVTVPTDAAYNFVIDPLNVAGLEVGGTLTQPQNDYKIIFGDDVALKVHSTSSFDQLLTVDAKFVDGGSDGTQAAIATSLNDITVNSAYDDGSEEIKPTILAQVVSNTVAVDADFDSDFSGTVGRAITAAGTKLEYLIEASEYENVVASTPIVEGEKVIVWEPKILDTEKGDGTLIYVTGTVSKKGDWSSYAPTVDKSEDENDPSKWTLVDPVRTLKIEVIYTPAEVVWGDGDGATFAEAKYEDIAAAKTGNAFVTGAYALLDAVRESAVQITGNISNDPGITAKVAGGGPRTYTFANNAVETISVNRGDFVAGSTYFTLQLAGLVSTAPVITLTNASGGSRAMISGDEYDYTNATDASLNATLVVKKLPDTGNSAVIEIKNSSGSSSFKVTVNLTGAWKSETP
ncbi:MAG: hypothetical protein LBS21_06060 [Clostridiales bacterium]|jgi:hypothetical protein|nr:hypothetical protein [Clostridiales bacterium]